MEPQAPPNPESIADWAAQLGAQWGVPEWSLLVAAASGVMLLIGILGLVLRWWLRRPPAVIEAPPIDRLIDVAKLDERGPVDEPPSVEVYGVPVRIAVIVLAPVGRDGVPPTPEQFTEIIEQLVPGFLAAVLRDQPLVRIWEGQLSTQGFTHAFFNNVPLPGDRGKGTPWCALSGRFSTLGKSYLAGVVGCASQANGLAQFAIQHEGQWHDVLRVRGMPSHKELGS